MKINISNPVTGVQKTVDIEDERKVRVFYDKRISQTVEADSLGDDFKGYVFKITGGFDKQGFPMMQGVLVPHRVRLLLRDGHPCFRERRKGERKRKSVRGCIVGPDISVVHVTILKKGPAELPGLEGEVPRRLGPKRATKIRKMFNLSKKDDVRKYVVRRVVPAKKEGKKPKTKAPKIQRLVTPQRLQRKRNERAERRTRAERNRADAAEYARLVALRNKEKKASLLSKRKSLRSSLKKSEKAGEKPAASIPPKEATQAAEPAVLVKGVGKGTKGSKPAKNVGAQATAKGAAKPAAKGAAKPAAKGAAKPAAAAAAPAAAGAKQEKPAAAAAPAQGKSGAGSKGKAPEKKAPAQKKQPPKK